MNEATPTSDQPDDPVTGVAAEAKPDAADGQSVEASAEGSDAGGARTDSKQGEGAHEPAPAADSNPSLKQVLTDPVLFLAFGFGSGLAPKGPGTAGTLVALLLFPLLAIMPMSAYLGFLVLVTGIGILVCGAAAKKLGVHDHGGIVWDEFAGFWLAMIGSPASIPWLILGFALFRLFDIWKPWPIRQLDQKVEGGFGIMLDDLVAGFYTLVLMSLLRYLL